MAVLSSQEVPACSKASLSLLNSARDGLKLIGFSIKAKERVLGAFPTLHSYIDRLL